jgi:gamma-glutamyltranspeptidase
LHSTYRGYDAYGLPPNSQGLTALQLLNILAHFDVASMGDEHPDYYHLQNWHTHSTTPTSGEACLRHDGHMPMLTPEI